MNRRTQRVGNLVRDVLGQLLLSKLSDPRIDPARTSITRVEVPEDLLTARVYVSVIGTEAEQRRTLVALRRAAGRLQELMGRQISLRNTPLLQFVEDKEFKRSLETYKVIQQAMDELRQKEQAAQEPSSDEKAPDPQAPDPDKPQEEPE